MLIDTKQGNSVLAKKKKDYKSANLRDMLSTGDKKELSNLYSEPHLLLHLTQPE